MSAALIVLFSIVRHRVSQFCESIRQIVSDLQSSDDGEHCAVAVHPDTGEALQPIVPPESCLSICLVKLGASMTSSQWSRNTLRTGKATMAACSVLFAQ